MVGIPFTCLWAGTYGKAVTCLWKQPGGCLRKTPPSLLVVKKIKKIKIMGLHCCAFLVQVWKITSNPSLIILKSVQIELFKIYS